MFIVDRDIKHLCQQHELIAEKYNEQNVGSISYDLTLQDVIVLEEDNETYNSYELKPNQTVFVSTLEVLKIPDNYVGIVTEKNSVMRQGLMVSTPYCQPGHRTKAYLRVTNISSNIITISSGKIIAQILFDKLSGTPECPYSQNQTASYNNELEFIGFGNYESTYEKEIKKIKKAENDLDAKANGIYANVMVFMGIIAAIFTLVTVNFEAFSSQNFSMINVLSLNLSLAFTILVFSGIALFIMGKKKSIVFYVIFFSVTLLTLVANLLLCFIFN